VRVLAVNCGSSTLKFAVFDAAVNAVDPIRVAGGSVDRIGAEASLNLELESGETFREQREIEDHAAAASAVIELLNAAHLAEGIGAIGHRVVHGGPELSQPVIVDAPVLAAIESVTELAPLHNRPALAAMESFRAHFATLPMVATFDTAFFASLPDVAARYAIPDDIATRLRVRRYGFHGLAHGYMVQRFRKIRPEIREPRLITLQLGNGCSAAATAGGRPVDTSMGFTPLEGLIMGTRSGDLDPSLSMYIGEKERLSPAEVEDVLNKRSGLLGLSGRSSDMRDLLAAAKSGDARAKLAVDAFCYRAKKYVGAYLAALGGADGLVFGGGIGENSADIREGICAGMTWAGIELDRDRNSEVSGREARISVDGSAVAVWVLPVDENLVIAGDTLQCLATKGVHPFSS
jgi:acetate kinase